MRSKELSVGSKDSNLCFVLFFNVSIGRWENIKISFVNKYMPVSKSTEGQPENPSLYSTMVSEGSEICDEPQSPIVDSVQSRHYEKICIKITTA